MTEAEHWNDFELTRGEIEAAIKAFYTYEEIHNFAREDENYHKINEHAIFWTTQLYSLQTTLFVVLGRIFDRSAHSVHKFLAEMVDCA